MEEQPCILCTEGWFSIPACVLFCLSPCNLCLLYPFSLGHLSMKISTSMDLPLQCFSRCSPYLSVFITTQTGTAMSNAAGAPAPIGPAEAECWMPHQKESAGSECFHGVGHVSERGTVRIIQRVFPYFSPYVVSKGGISVNPSSARNRFNCNW